MKNIPVFTTEYGVASLSLGQIQSRGEAFIRVQDIQPGRMDLLIRECAAFCRAAGAERVYASQWAGEPAYSVIEMRGLPLFDPDQVENLFPATEATVARWREIYNNAMQNVHHSRYLSGYDEEKILSSGGAYFVHRRGDLLGIGWVEDQKILAVASCKPGFGFRVAQTLLSVMADEPVSLEVASSNTRAIRLYERLGLVKTAEISRWYEITGCFQEKTLDKHRNMV